MIDDSFLHDLRNELQLLKLLIDKLDVMNEATFKINSVIDSIVSKCMNTSSDLKTGDSAFNVNTVIELMCSYYPNIIFEKELNEKISCIANKSKFHDVLINLIKNAKEAGATKVKFETKFKSLIVSDNGACTMEIVEKLNNSNVFTTKEDGSGLGSQCVRKFCERNGCRVSYHLMPNIDPNKGTFVLGVKIKFP